MRAQRPTAETQLAAETPIQPFPVSTVFQAHDLLKTENGYKIRGSECCGCGRKFFPRPAICLGCAGTDLRDCLLGPRGRLYSFTTVHVSSSRATPYTIGYIDLDEGARLLATIAGDPRALSPDIPVQLAGNKDRWTFEPVSELTTKLGPRPSYRPGPVRRPSRRHGG